MMSHSWKIKEWVGKSVNTEGMVKDKYDEADIECRTLGKSLDFTVNFRSG